MRHRHSRARGPLRLAALAALAALAVFVAAGCVPVARVTYPPVGSTTAPAGAAAASTAGEVIRALGVAGLPSAVADRGYRPPEGPAFAAAPRLVVQATLPDDPAHGYVVVYEFASNGEAAAAAADQAAYVASGPGRVQFVPDAHLVLRLLGSTAVFYWWSPGSALDPRAADIEAALGTVGTAIAIPG